MAKLNLKKISVEQLATLYLANKSLVAKFLASLEAQREEILRRAKDKPKTFRAGRYVLEVSKSSKEVLAQKEKFIAAFGESYLRKRKLIRRTPVTYVDVHYKKKAA